MDLLSLHSEGEGQVHHPSGLWLAEFLLAFLPWRYSFSLSGLLYANSRGRSSYWSRELHGWLYMV